MRVLPAIRHFLGQCTAKDHGVLLAASAFLFSWGIFDGIIAFITPVLMEERGLSNSVIGLVLGFSSVGGALFDLLLYRILPTSNFRRIFLAVIALSLLFPLVMWNATVLWAYLLAMALWGLYYDLRNIGMYDFVSRHPAVNANRAGDFGIIEAFTCLAYFIAPLIAGALIAETVGVTPFLAALAFLGVSAVFYGVLLVVTKNDWHYLIDRPRRPIRLNREIHLWRKLGPAILPVMLLVMATDVVDSYFWTIGPLFAEELGMGIWAGALVASYMLPALVLGFFVGSITKRFGEERVASVSLVAASLLLLLFSFIETPLMFVFATFAVACCSALAVPASSGRVADYISHKRAYATEIETIEDTFVNTGWVIGPIVAGIASEYLGYASAFSVLGVGGIVVALIFWQFAPRKSRL